MDNDFEEIQELLRVKAELTAKLNLLPYDATPEIKENASRLIKVLCIEKPKNQEMFLEFSDDLNEEEKEDLLNLASELVGEFND